MALVSGYLVKEAYFESLQIIIAVIHVIGSLVFSIGVVKDSKMIMMVVMVVKDDFEIINHLIIIIWCFIINGNFVFETDFDFDSTIRCFIRDLLAFITRSATI